MKQNQPLASDGLVWRWPPGGLATGADPTEWNKAESHAAESSKVESQAAQTQAKGFFTKWFFKFQGLFKWKILQKAKWKNWEF